MQAQVDPLAAKNRAFRRWLVARNIFPKAPARALLPGAGISSLAPAVSAQMGLVGYRSTKLFLYGS
jgi:hypothetical protein